MDEDGNKVHFESEAVINQEELAFVDKSCENTTIHFLFSDTKMVLQRDGDTQMEMVFDLQKRTNGFYENSEGLRFDFLVECTHLECTNQKITIHYTMILDKQTKTKHKISLLLNETLAKTTNFR